MSISKVGGTGGAGGTGPVEKPKENETQGAKSTTATPGSAEARAPTPVGRSKEAQVGSASFAGDLLRAKVAGWRESDATVAGAGADTDAPAPVGEPQAEIRASPAAAARAAEFKKAVEGGDSSKAADVIAASDPEDLPALEREIPPRDGISGMAGFLGRMRTADKDAYRKAIGALTEKAADTEPGARAKWMLVQHLNGVGGAAEDYVDRFFGGYTVMTESQRAMDGAVVVLGATGETGLGALIRREGYLGSGELAAVLEKFPPELVDRVAGRLVQEPRPLRDSAAVVLFRAGTPAGKEDGAFWYASGAAEDAGKLGPTQIEIDRDIRYAKRTLAELAALRALNAAEDESLLTPAGRAKLDADIAEAESNLRVREQRKEELGRKMYEELQDPELRRMLLTLPPEQRAAFMAPFIDNMKDTTYAGKLYEEEIEPALADATKTTLYKDIFSGTDKTRKLATETVIAFAAYFAKDGPTAWGETMQKVLGKTPEEVAKLEAAVGKFYGAAKGSADEAAAAKEIQKLAGAGVDATKVATAFAGMALMFSLRTAANDPDLLNVVKASKDAASLASGLTKIMAANPRYEAASKLLGGASKAASFVAAGLTVYSGYLSMNAAIDQLDLGGAVGAYLEAAGGVFTAASPVFPPLALVGAALGLGGFGVTMIFGDSRDERTIKAFAQRNGYEVE